MAVLSALILDESIAYEIRVTGTNTGPLTTGEGTLPPTNRPLELTMAVFADAERSGLYRTVRRYYDVADLLRQLGLDR